MSLSRNPLTGEPLVERLLELEAAKHAALLAFDPASYETSAAAQACLVEAGDWRGASASRVLELAGRMRLNSALLLNLISISPHFALARDGYTAEGAVRPESQHRIVVRG